MKSTKVLFMNCDYCTPFFKSLIAVSMALHDIVVNTWSDCGACIPMGLVHSLHLFNLIVTVHYYIIYYGINSLS